MDRNAIDGRGYGAVGDLAATIVTILQAPIAGMKLYKHAFILIPYKTKISLFLQKTFF